MPESQCGNFVVDSVLYRKPVQLSEFTWQETKGRGSFLLAAVDNYVSLPGWRQRVGVRSCLLR